MNTYGFVVILTLSFGFCKTSKVHFEHIFDESALCEFYDPSLPKDFQRFYIMNKLYQYTEEVNGKPVTLYFYPCRKKKIPNCGEESAVCMISHQNKKEFVRNFGQSFKYSVTNSERYLESIDGEPCTSSKNHTITIKFSCNEDVVHQKSECNWILEMHDYTSCKRPFYTSTMDNHIINLRSLAKMKSLHITTQNNNTFFLSFFKQSEECETGVSVCELTNKGDITSLSDASQTFEYDNNKLTITGHYGSNKKSKITTIVHIKCNWASEALSNGKRIESKSQRKYIFEVESSLACIKLPLNCLIMDPINNFMYNISGLNRPNDGWQVTNYNNSGIIKINVCGPLNLKNQEKSSCNDEFSQICLRETSNGSNSYTNLGSIPFNFQVDNYTVKGTFVEGSVCSKNSNRTISTEIEFICDDHENGPEFVDNADDCTYKLKWKTPLACPILYRKSEDNCKFNDIDLSGLHMTDDRILILADSSRLRYNLCGSLTQPCRDHPNVSFCWIKGEIETPVGYTSQTLVQNNDLLSLNLDGKECGGNNRYSTKINFVCNYSVSLQKKVLNQQMIDNCTFEITIATPLACRTVKKMECAVNSDVASFNLTSLKKLDGDYYFKDTDESNITYILNVCSPITNPLCLPDSAICMVNRTNHHLHFKYKQIGYFGSTKLEYENETLKLNYKFGSSCSYLNKYQSTITFLCLTPSDKSEGPTLVNKSNCFYEFQWKTKYACLNKTKKSLLDEKVKILPVNNPIDREIIESISTTRKTTSTSSTISTNNENMRAENSMIVTPKMHSSTIKPTRATMAKLQNCPIIKNKETNYKFNLTTLKTIRIKSEHNNYSVVFDQVLNSCQGFICKNEQMFMPLIDICPSVKFNYSNAMVKLSYVSPGCINGDEFKSDILLKCNPTDDTPSIAKATNCRTEIVVPTNAACLLLQKLEVTTSSAGVAIGSSVGFIILLILLIGGFIFFKKRHTNYFTRICYQRIPTDKSSVAVYCKDTNV